MSGVEERGGGVGVGGCVLRARFGVNGVECMGVLGVFA